MDTKRIMANVAAAKRGFRAAAAAGWDMDRDGCTMLGVSVYPGARDAFVRAACPPRAQDARRRWWANKELWRDTLTPSEADGRRTVAGVVMASNLARPTEVSALRLVANHAALLERSVRMFEMASWRDEIVKALYVEVRTEHVRTQAAIARMTQAQREAAALGAVYRGMRSALDFSAVGAVCQYNRDR